MQTDECDARGVPLCGRRTEHDRLRAAGADDLAWGRLYEGHVNALQLIARCGDDVQRARAVRDLHDGLLFGVWNTEAQNGVRGMLDDGAVVLTGAKTFASGAGRVARAIVTVRFDDGVRMALVPMDRVEVAIDRSFWKPYGMERSDSFAVDFTGVRLASDDFIGPMNAYYEAPWFAAGASRFVAVQTGGVEQLVADYADFIRRRKTADDPVVLTRLGECVVAARTARLWTDACAIAWERYDAEPDAEYERDLSATVEAARLAVERAALDVAERVERGVSARGLLDGEPFAQRLRDVRMYLRQPAADSTAIRVARETLAGEART